MTIPRIFYCEFCRKEHLNMVEPELKNGRYGQLMINLSEITQKSHCPHCHRLMKSSLHRYLLNYTEFFVYLPCSREYLKSLWDILKYIWDNLGENERKEFGKTINKPIDSPKYSIGPIIFNEETP